MDQLLIFYNFPIPLFYSRDRTLNEGWAGCPPPRATANTLDFHVTGYGRGTDEESLFLTSSHCDRTTLNISKIQKGLFYRGCIRKEAKACAGSK